MLLRLLCFAAGVMLGRTVAGRRSWPALGAGALTASILFYLVTNSATWFADSAYAPGATGLDAPYARTLAGWWQALTIGHPGLPSTLYFFRNTFVSDLLFTAGFALIMEYAALRRGETSLLARRA
jgi:hypothetical protein